MESSLAWLDLNEEGRQQMQEHLALLNEPDTMDQLGIGQVRDVFSSLFFPGTSTLWRRARYMLFVPWVYQELEVNGTGKLTGEAAARGRQTALIRALKAGPDRNADGLIGARTDEPERMPDELLWNGLRSWGIRRREGSLSKYRRKLEAGEAGGFEVKRGDFEEVLDAESGSWWHERLPPAPRDLLQTTDFGLRGGDAAFLRDQLQEHAPDSLLARMTMAPAMVGEHDYPWEERKAVKRLSVQMQATMDHARVFSYGMQGAGLLYSYLVARKRDAGNVDDLAERFTEWSGRLQKEGALADVKGWRKRREAFWPLIKDHNRRLRIGTEEFVDTWMAVAPRSPVRLLKDSAVLDLIRQREWSVKRHLARLSNEAALDRARDESGTGQLDFRWRQGKQIVNDIAAGLGEGPIS